MMIMMIMMVMMIMMLLLYDYANDNAEEVEQGHEKDENNDDLIHLAISLYSSSIAGLCSITP